MTLKKILKGLALGSLSVLFSCSSGGSSQLSVSLSSKSFILLNSSQVSTQAQVEATEAQSIPTADKQAVSFLLPNITVTWSNSNQPVQIEYIEVVLNGLAFTGNPFGYQFASQELGYDWLNSLYCPGGYSATTGTPTGCLTLSGGGSTPSGIYLTSTSPANQLATPIAAGTSAVIPVTNQGQFIVGGVPLPDTTQNYSGSATVYVYGVYTDGSGNQNPVTAQAVASWTYTGVP